jgi:hypothetical protein
VAGEACNGVDTLLIVAGMGRHLAAATTSIPKEVQATVLDVLDTGTMACHTLDCACTRIRTTYREPFGPSMLHPQPVATSPCIPPFRRKRYLRLSVYCAGCRSCDCLVNVFCSITWLARHVRLDHLLCAAAAVSRQLRVRRLLRGDNV